MRSDADRLNDILEAIGKIQDRARCSCEVFEQNEMLQVWVVHHLQVIGEATRGLSETLKDRYPEVRWPEIVALRNILVHEYFGLNLHQIWIMIQKDVPILKEQIRRITGS